MHYGRRSYALQTLGVPQTQAVIPLGSGTIDNTDGVGYACCIWRGGPFVTGPVEGPQTPKTGPGANGPPTRIQRVRAFQPVCIVFISPPEVEMCVL